MKIIKIFLFIIYILLPLQSLTYASQVSLFEEQKKEKSFVNNDYNFRYLLGPGDTISIELINLDTFNKTIKILPDGTINLRRIGSIYISDLTIDEASKKITQEYKKILYDPIVYIDLVNPRPIKISIIGEVQRPGIYSISQLENNTLSNSDGGESFSTTSKGWPTLIDGLQKAGGVTSDADIRSINILRYTKNGSLPLEYKINYWDVLVKGLKIKNPLIYDGDIISVKKIEKSNDDEIIKISKSNLSPATISVTVIGEVANPGVTNIRSGAPLTEAIFASGGLKRTAKKTKIKLFRLKSNGSVDSRNLNYNTKLSINDLNNPSLRDRDVIVIGKNTLAKLNIGLKSAVEPFSPLIQAASIYRLFN